MSNLVSRGQGWRFARYESWPEGLWFGVPGAW